MPNTTVMILENNASLRFAWRSQFQLWATTVPDLSLDILEASGEKKAKALSENRSVDIAIVDHKLDDGDGVGYASWILAKSDSAVVFVTTAFEGEVYDSRAGTRVDEAYNHLRREHFDRIVFAEKGDLEGASVIDDLKSAVLTQLRKCAGERHGYVKELIAQIPTRSLAMQQFLSELSPHVDSRVVVLGGKIGSGKTYLAEALHRARMNLELTSGEFRNVTLTETDPNLIRSQLFGHVKGAFTGANEDRTGAIEESNGGTVLLDEIADFPLDVQGVLLSVLNNGTYRRVGEAKQRSTQSMFILATHRNLDELVKAGRFRSDLYSRIKTLQFTVPSLAERREDIILLAECFVQEWNSKRGTEITLGNSAIHALETWDFEDGGVRDLRGLLMDYALPRAAAEGRLKLSVSHLPVVPSVDTEQSGSQELVCPDSFHEMGADFGKIREYIRVCIKLLEQCPSKRKWQLKDVDDHLGTNGRFKGYVNSHPMAFALVLDRNWDVAQKATRILGINGKIKEELIRRGRA